MLANIVVRVTILKNENETEDVPFSDREWGN
jgi:hypothetical protein